MSVVVLMSADEPPGGEGQLTPDQLKEYVRDVMGWTAYQAEAYVAVVQNGPVEPSEIVATTEVPQGRIYDVMGELEGTAVNVQGRQPKAYQAQHPRSLLGDKQDVFNSKADSAIGQLEQQHEIQRERRDARHPAWVISGIGGTKRELTDALEKATGRVLLMEESGEWIQSSERQQITTMVGQEIDVEILGWSNWREQLESLAQDTGASVWVCDRIDSSFALIDDELAIVRVGRGRTGIKIKDQGMVDILNRAFESAKKDAEELDTHG